MNIIAITGNIASGKSTISRIIPDHYNLPLISVDEFSRHYIEAHKLIFKAILQECGYECKQDDVRETLKKYFFKDKKLKDNVERHVASGFWKYLSNHTINHYNKAILVEYPTLFERYDVTHFSFIIGVFANRHIRVDRMKERRYSDETIAERLDNQIDLMKNHDKLNLILDNSIYLTKEQIIHELENSRAFKELIS